MFTLTFKEVDSERRIYEKLKSELWDFIRSMCVSMDGNRWLTLLAHKPLLWTVIFITPVYTLR